MASFSCKCGKVHVSFQKEKARTRVHCHCCDCKQKHEWAAANGGIALHEGHINFEKPFWGEHFDARMEVTGKENLIFNKLHEKSHSTNCIAKCCSTLLFADHPAYHGNSVLIFPEMIQLQNSVHEEKPLLITWIKDWSDEHAHKIDDSVPAAYMDENGEFTGVGNWGEAFQELMSRISAPCEEEGGQQFADLLAESGGEVINLGFEPRRRH